MAAHSSILAQEIPWTEDPGGLESTGSQEAGHAQVTKQPSQTTGVPLHGSDGKESTCNAGDLDSIPGLRRSPGGANGYPLQYSHLENSMNKAGNRD